MEQSNFYTDEEKEVFTDRIAERDKPIAEFKVEKKEPLDAYVDVLDYGATKITLYIHTELDMNINTRDLLKDITVPLRQIEQIIKLRDREAGETHEAHD